MAVTTTNLEVDGSVMEGVRSHDYHLTFSCICREVKYYAMPLFSLAC